MSEPNWPIYSMVPEKRKTVIPNKPRRSHTDSARVAVVHHRVVAVGRLDSQKNFALLIDSIADVDKTKVTLDIYGEGHNVAWNCRK